MTTTMTTKDTKAKQGHCNQTFCKNDSKTNFDDATQAMLKQCLVTCSCSTNNLKHQERLQQTKLQIITISVNSNGACKQNA